MAILLTDEEIDGGVFRYRVEDAKYPEKYRITARAQLKKVVEYLSNRSQRDDWARNIRMREFEWQALRKEAGL